MLFENATQPLKFGLDVGEGGGKFVNGVTAVELQHPIVDMAQQARVLYEAGLHASALMTARATLSWSASASSASLFAAASVSASGSVSKGGVGGRRAKPSGLEPANDKTAATTASERALLVAAHRAHALHTCALCLAKEHESRRAIVLLEAALASLQKHNHNSTNSSLAAFAAATRIAVCTDLAAACIQAADPKRAVNVIEANIPHPARSLAVLTTLCRAYEAINNNAANHKLVGTLSAIVRQHPFAIEPMKQLISLGQSVQHVLSLVAQSSVKGGITVNVAATPVDWIEPLLHAHRFQLDCNFKDAKGKLLIAQEKLKSNIDLQLEIANCHVNDGNFILAHYMFDQVRQNDPYVVKHMDRYARILQSQGTPMQLNRLATDLINLTEERPEPWLVMARYLETRGDYERAMQLADKSLLLDQRHVEAHLLRGSLLLQLHNPQEATVAFRTAHQLSPSLESYRGLLESYLQCKRHNEALAIAKEAMSRIPGSARAVVLVGVALSHIPERRAQAKAAFQRALELDPKCHEALYALAGTLVAEGAHAAAVDLLQRSAGAAGSTAHVLHTRLGDIYTVMKSFEEALDQYNVALRMQAGYEPARLGYERVEKLLGKADDGALSGGGGVAVEADVMDESGGEEILG
ncbi:hypothetical protein BC830DRAFT_1163437 [Chytriomyces sp. MP71]|nr:hypothetical protein BC830DRAFT_1163437 [Chytriomyces sp. MP71]